MLNMRMLCEREFRNHPLLCDATLLNGQCSIPVCAVDPYFKLRRH